MIKVRIEIYAGFDLTYEGLKYKYSITIEEIDERFDLTYEGLKSS